MTNRYEMSVIKSLLEELGAKHDEILLAAAWEIYKPIARRYWQLGLTNKQNATVLADQIRLSAKWEEQYEELKRGAEMTALELTDMYNMVGGHE